MPQSPDPSRIATIEVPPHRIISVWEVGSQSGHLPRWGNEGQIPQTSGKILCVESPCGLVHRLGRIVIWISSSLGEDGELLISSGSAIFLRSPWNLARRTADNHLFCCRIHTVQSVRSALEKQARIVVVTLRLPFWHRRHLYEPDWPYLLLPLRFLVIGILEMLADTVFRRRAAYSIRLSREQSLSLRGWMSMYFPSNGVRGSGVLGDPNE